MDYENGNQQNGHDQDNDQDQFDIDYNDIGFFIFCIFQILCIMGKIIGCRHVFYQVYSGGSHIGSMIVIVDNSHFIFFSGIVGYVGIQFIKNGRFGHNQVAVRV